MLVTISFKPGQNDHYGKTLFAIAVRNANGSLIAHDTMTGLLHTAFIRSSELAFPESSGVSSGDMAAVCDCEIRCTSCVRELCVERASAAEWDYFGDGSVSIVFDPLFEAFIVSGDDSVEHDCTCERCGDVIAEYSGDPQESWFVGIGLPGCLYDSVSGPFDSESDALDYAESDDMELTGNYIYEIYSRKWTSRQEYENEIAAL